MFPEFIWDPAKARANWRKHGVRFEEAAEAFRDPDALEDVDADLSYGETRLALIGATGNGLIFVVYTERGAAIRIISARWATPRERRRYLDEHS